MDRNLSENKWTLTSCDMHVDRIAELRVNIEDLQARIAELEAGIREAATELHSCHRGEIIYGDKTGCVICYPNGGSGTCTAAAVAFDLDALLIPKEK